MNGEHHFLVCKHKYMFKNGAPPDNVGVLFPLLPVECFGVNNRRDF